MPKATKSSTPLGAGAAGYSPKPLLAKLGMKPGARYLVEAAPDGYLALLGPLPAGSAPAAARGTCDFIQLFVERRKDLERALPKLKARLEPAGMIWVSWPKKTSGIATDVTEDVVRTLALAGGLVDVKVAAVTEIWSGLKLVIPVKDRPR